MNGVSKPKLFIYGASGHAKVVIDAAESESKFEILGLLDDNIELHGSEFFGYSVLGGIEQIGDAVSNDAFGLIAIGSNAIRKRVSEQLSELGVRFGTVVHPSAQLGRGVTIGSGSVLMAGVVVNTDVEVGRHVILNTGATIDHDCYVGNFVHISPGAHLAGAVTVEELSHVGIGASVIQNVTIGKECTIGAGAAVIRDIPDGVTAVGVPAKVAKS